MASYRYEKIDDDKILRSYGNQITYLSKNQIMTELWKGQVKKLLETGYLRINKLPEKPVSAKQQEREAKRKAIEERKKQREDKRKEREQLIARRQVKKLSKEKRMAMEFMSKSADYKSEFINGKYTLFRRNPKGYYDSVSTFEDKIQEEAEIQKDIANLKKNKIKRIEPEIDSLRSYYHIRFTYCMDCKHNNCKGVPDKICNRFKYFDSSCSSFEK